MRILIIGINYHPELTGIGKYTAEMAEWLVQKGHEVRVITAPPYYPAWRVHEEYSAWWYRFETIAGVHVFRCPFWVPRNPGGLKRILHLLSFAISSSFPLLWSGLIYRPDWVLAIEPPLMCAPSALAAAALARGRSWLHIQDFEVDAAFELGFVTSARLRRWAKAVESWLMCRFDRVSTISHRMLDRLGQKGVRESRRVLFQNWVDLDRIRPLSNVSPLRTEWGLADNDIVVLYSGNMGEKQGLELLIESARLLQDRPGIVFILCGDGPLRPKLVDEAKDIPNVIFKLLQPLERLNDLLNVAVIHVLPQREDVADLVLPSKLTNMLASGRPVVATAMPGTQVADLVEDCGIVVAPGDAQALAEAVSSLADSPGLRRQLGSKARSLAEKHWRKNDILSGFMAAL